jgi:hypothetical protein
MQARNVLQSTQQQINCSKRPKGGERRNVTCATCITVAVRDHRDHKYQNSKYFGFEAPRWGGRWWNSGEVTNVTNDLILSRMRGAFPFAFFL